MAARNRRQTGAPFFAMSDKQDLAFQLAVLDVLIALCNKPEASDLAKLEAMLNTLREETAKTLADWYPPEPPKVGDPEKYAEIRTTN